MVPPRLAPARSARAAQAATAPITPWTPRARPSRRCEKKSCGGSPVQRPTPSTRSTPARGCASGPGSGRRDGGGVHRPVEGEPLVRQVERLAGAAPVLLDARIVVAGPARQVQRIVRRLAAPADTCREPDDVAGLVPAD